MKVRVKRVDGKKLALISAICMGLFSIIFIPIFFIIGKIDGEMTGSIKYGVILVPFIYFIFTYIATRIIIGLFNLVLKWFDGFEIEAEGIGIATDYNQAK